MKRILKSAVAVLLTLTVAACGSKSGKAIATVNGENITYSRYVQELALFKSQIQMQFGDSIWSQTFPGSDETFLQNLKTQILDNLVVNTLLKQEAEKAGLKLDEAKYNEAVKQTLDGMNKDEMLKKYYEDNKINEEYIKQMIKESMLAQAYHDDYISKNAATEDEIKKYYEDNKATQFTDEQVKASHILIKTQDQDGNPLPQDQQDAAKAKIDDIAKKIKAGESFEALAKEFSQDGSKDNGGDLGYFRKNEMVPEFEQKAFSMNVGEISEPVKTQYGYHLIKLTDKKSSTSTLEEVKDSIKSTIEEKKFSDYLTKLKDDKEKVKKSEDLLKDAEKDIKEDALKQEPAADKNATKDETSKEETKDAAKDAPATEQKETDKTETESKAK